MPASIHAPTRADVSEARPLDWRPQWCDLASLTGSALLLTGLATTLQRRPQADPPTLLHSLMVAEAGVIRLEGEG